MQTKEHAHLEVCFGYVNKTYEEVYAFVYVYKVYIYIDIYVCTYIYICTDVFLHVYMVHVYVPTPTFPETCKYISIHQSLKPKC